MSELENDVIWLKILERVKDSNIGSEALQESLINTLIINQILRYFKNKPETSDIVNHIFAQIQKSVTKMEKGQITTDPRIKKAFESTLEILKPLKN